MKLPPRRISIGTRLALQYGLALLASLVLFAVLVEAQVERRISREAQLLLRLQMVDLLDDFNERMGEQGRAGAEAWFAHHATLLTAQADPTIGLGIELLTSEGASQLASGTLSRAGVPVDRALLEGRRSQSFRAVNLGREHAYLSLTEAVEGGFIRVAVDTGRFSDNVEDIRRIFLVSIPLVLLVSSGAGFFLSRRAIRPLAEINRAARRISSERLDAAIPISGSGDELDQLAETLNAMMERIRSGVQRLGRFSANAAHELRSPLNRIQNRVESLALRGGMSGDERETLAAVTADVETMSREIEAMLHLARFEQGLTREQRQPTDLAELARTVVEFFEPEARERGIAMETEVGETVEIDAEETWLRTMLSNLLSNAIKYSDPGGRISVRLERGPELVRFTVADTGPGIPPERIASVFERFDRGAGHSAEPGFGLGLPIAQEIARAHGGEITVSSQLGHGTAFVVTIPLPE